MKPLVQSTKAVVASQKDAAGVHFQGLPTEMEKLCSYGFQPYDQQKMSKFQKEVYDPYVTALSHHLEARFPDVALIDAFSIFDPTEMPNNPAAKFPSSLQQRLQVLKAHYGPCNIIDPEKLLTEYQLLVASVELGTTTKEQSPYSVMCKLIEKDELKAMFPNLWKLACIGLVLPMSTADCERGFSSLARIKSDLRSRLSSKILNSLMIISIEGLDPDQFPYEKTCKIWSSWRNRKICV